MEKSSSIAAFAKAFLSAQMEMEKAKKAQSRGANNPIKGNYANINDVIDAAQPVLNKNGIAVLQPIALIEGFCFVETTLLHTSGEYISGSMTPVINPQANNAQTQGAGITYARRYGLQAILSLGTEDDDDGASLKGIETVKTKAGEPVVTELTAEEKYLKLITECKTKEDLTALKNGGIPGPAWTQKLGAAALHQFGVIGAAESKAFAEAKEQGKGSAINAVLSVRLDGDKSEQPANDTAEKSLPVGVQKSHATLIGHGVVKNTEAPPSPDPAPVDDELAGL